MLGTETQLAIDAVWRIESPRLIAGLARLVRDVGLAEDLAQDALVAALEQWPQAGVPDRPGAWLMAAARHRAIDHIRRNKLLERKHAELGRELEAQQAAPDLDAALGEEALRLGRILAELVPREPEVHGLVALMEIHASRSRARVGPTGEPILLLDQNRAQWDRLLIRRGLAALDRAGKLGGPRGPYAVQAAIAACHARALTPAETDWREIVRLYAELARLVPS